MASRKNAHANTPMTAPSWARTRVPSPTPTAASRPAPSTAPPAWRAMVAPASAIASPWPATKARPIPVGTAEPAAPKTSPTRAAAMTLAARPDCWGCSGWPSGCGSAGSGPRRWREDVSKQALVELRPVLGVLRQIDEGAPRAPSPGLERLDELAATTRAAGLAVQVEQVGDPIPHPASVDLDAYRIVQEALTNTVRHSGGS